MYNFQLPPVKGIELFPDAIKAPIAVRIVTEDDTFHQGIQDVLEARANDVAHFRMAQMQHYALSPGTHWRAAAEFDDMSVEYINNHGYETLVVKPRASTSTSPHPKKERKHVPYNFLEVRIPWHVVSPANDQQLRENWPPDIQAFFVVRGLFDPASPRPDDVSVMPRGAAVTSPYIDSFDANQLDAVQLDEVNQTDLTIRAWLDLRFLSDEAVAQVDVYIYEGAQGAVLETQDVGSSATRVFITADTSGLVTINKWSYLWPSDTQYGNAFPPIPTGWQGYFGHPDADNTQFPDYVAYGYDPNLGSTYTYLSDPILSGGTTTWPEGWLRTADATFNVKGSTTGHEVTGKLLYERNFIMRYPPIPLAFDIHAMCHMGSAHLPIDTQLPMIHPNVRVDTLGYDIDRTFKNNFGGQYIGTILASRKDGSAGFAPPK